MLKRAIQRWLGIPSAMDVSVVPAEASVLAVGGAAIVVLSVDAPLSKSDMDLIRDQWDAGMNSANRTVILSHGVKLRVLRRI